MGLLPPLRRRSRVLFPAPRTHPRRGFRLSVGRADRLRPRRAGVPRQYVDPGNPPVRPERRLRRHHGLRATVPPSRTDVLSHDAGATDQTRRRESARPDPGAPGSRLRPPARHYHLGLEPHSIRRWGGRLTPDDGRRSHGDHGGEPVLPRGYGDPDPRTGRDGRRRGRRFGEPLPRRHRRLLAGLGALARDPVRVAGRRDPRGHHAGAQRLRGHRRHRRGDDDLGPRSPRNRPDLGLPLLLAAGRLLRRERPQPARRHPDDGALPELRREHRGRRPRRRAPAAGVWIDRAGGGGGTSDRVVTRLSRHRPGASRQSGIQPGPARRVRSRHSDGHPRVLRPAPGAAGRWG